MAWAESKLISRSRWTRAPGGSWRHLARRTGVREAQDVGTLTTRSDTSATERTAASATAFTAGPARRSCLRSLRLIRLPVHVPPAPSSPTPRADAAHERTGQAADRRPDREPDAESCQIPLVRA